MGLSCLNILSEKLTKRHKSRFLHTVERKRCTAAKKSHTFSGCRGGGGGLIGPPWAWLKASREPNLGCATLISDRHTDGGACLSTLQPGHPQLLGVRKYLVLLFPWERS